MHSAMENGEGQWEKGKGARELAVAGPHLSPHGRRRFPFSIFPFSFSLWLTAILAATLVTTACGYRVAGRGSALPGEWRTLAVVALENRTQRYRIEQRLTEALVRELIARTRFRIVHDPSAADAAISGAVTGIETSPVLFDASTGRATTLVISVRLQAVLADHAGRVVWRNDDFLFREQYELSTDVASFFDESEPALDRLARDFAASLVSAILEDF
jgi:outer membrane lipopolysaccharide assembly protein LptE/RlpB